MTIAANGGSFSERLGTILNVGEVIEEVKKIVKQVLGVDSVEVVLENPDTELMHWLLRFGESISIEELSCKQPHLFEKNREFLQKLDAYILVSLNAKQRLLGILAVGRKAGQDRFSNEEGIRKQLSWTLAPEFEVLEAADKNTALSIAKEQRPDLVALDVNLTPGSGNGKEGMELLLEILALQPQAKVIMITANDPLLQPTQR